MITPIGQLQDGDTIISSPEETPVALGLRQRLLDIQTGRGEDTHGWLNRLA